MDYLNSAPLGWSFLHGPLKGKFEVIPSSPAECADQLARGEVDVGLIPSIEYQRIRIANCSWKVAASNGFDVVWSGQRENESAQ